MEKPKKKKNPEEIEEDDLDREYFPEDEYFPLNDSAEDY